MHDPFEPRHADRVASAGDGVIEYDAAPFLVQGGDDFLERFQRLVLR